MKDYEELCRESQKLMQNGIALLTECGNDYKNSEGLCGEQAKKISALEDEKRRLTETHENTVKALEDKNKKLREAVKNMVKLGSEALGNE